MASRVNITVTARDLTGRDLDRIRHSFNRLGDDVNRLGNQRTQANMTRLRDSLNGMGGDLARLRGRIPTDEFDRLSEAYRRADNVMRNAHGFPLASQSMGDMRRALRDLQGGLGRLGGDSNVRVRVRPDVDRNAFRRGLHNAIAPALQGIQGLLSDGIGQGLGNAFSAAAKNPAVLAGVAAVVTLAASLIGAGLAGALVFAFGAAFVGLGGFIASKAPEVKKAWSGMVDDVKASWASAGKAMEPVVTHGIDLLGKLADSFLPHFQEAMRQSAGPVTDFLNHVSEGIKIFGRRAFKPLMEGFNALLLAFGPEFETLMGGMGDSFGALGRTVRDHSGEIAMAMRMIFGLITTIIDVINFLANAWVTSLSIMTMTVGMFIKGGILPMADAAMSAFSTIVNGAAAAFGWLPGIGPKVKAAAKQFNDFGKGIHDKLNGMANDAIDWGKNMDAANKERVLRVNIGQWQEDLKQAKADLKASMSGKAVKKLTADISDWSTKLATAKAKLKDTTNTKAKAKLQADITDLEGKIRRGKQLLADQSRRKSKSQIRGDISDLQAKLRTAGAKLAQFDGRTVTAYMVTVLKTRDERASATFRRMGGITGMAHGGVSRASAATRDIMVGEAGPEMVRLPPGSQVRTAGGTKMAMRGDEGGGGATLVLQSSGRRADDMLLELLRDSIHQRGGDPVRVLGGKS